MDCLEQYKLTVLRIDFIQYANHSHSKGIPGWLKANGSWMFSAIELGDPTPPAGNANVDWTIYLKESRESDVIVHSEEYLTLNMAARSFYLYLKQMKDERTEIVFSQNTKFDAMKAQAEPDSKDFYDIL